MDRDRDNFMVMIKNNQNLIYKISACYCSDPEDRKDLQQEILIQLWKSFKLYDGRAKISTWLYRISINVAISHYRKRKGDRKKVPISENILMIHDDDNAQNKERIELLYQCINCLDEFDKALILLYLDGNKYTDISEIMGISETNVATKICRIKKVLKNRLLIFND